MCRRIIISMVRFAFVMETASFLQDGAIIPRKKAPVKKKIHNFFLFSGTFYENCILVLEKDQRFSKAAAALPIRLAFGTAVIS